MGLQQRLAVYGQIEAHRKRPLLVYITSKRDGVDASMATDVLPFLIDQLDKLPPDTKELDFLIVSFGGDPMVAWRIMSLIRHRGIEKVSVLIPQSAYSAATLLALGANEIVMHPNGHLGPVDMQITTNNGRGGHHFSTEDISAFLEFVREHLGITDQKHLRTLFESTCDEIGSLGVGFVARSTKLAVALAKQLLEMHTSKESAAANDAIVSSLSREIHSHAYPVSRNEAISIGLPVNKERDSALESLLWSAWLDLESELQERKPFRPIVEVLADATAAAQLLSPVPQLAMPPNASGPSYLQANIAETKAAVVEVPPVKYEHIVALVESTRLAVRNVKKGEILACRLPDLNIQYNVLVSFRGWETSHTT